MKQISTSVELFPIDKSYITLNNLVLTILPGFPKSAYSKQFYNLNFETVIVISTYLGDDGKKVVRVDARHSSDAPQIFNLHPSTDNITVGYNAGLLGSRSTPTVAANGTLVQYVYNKFKVNNGPSFSVYGKTIESYIVYLNATSYNILAVGTTFTIGSTTVIGEN